MSGSPVPCPVVAETLVAPENDYTRLLGLEIASPALRVAVVIPVYNRVELLRRTLAGVAAQTYPNDLLSVVIADDGSEENVAGVLEDFNGSLSITLVRREHEGYGAGQARNLGAAEVEGADVLVFFDADCIPDPAAVERHTAWHHAANNLVVIGSRHHLDTSSLTATEITADPMALRRLALGTEVPHPGDWASDDYRKTLHRRSSRLRYGDEAFRSLVSSNFSVGRRDYLSVGGFSGDFHRWGGEDTELGWRLWNEGSFFVDDPQAAIYHQLQDDLGTGGWREESRQANDGLIQSKIPHRFYRSTANTINETPKVSVVVHAPDEGRIEELTAQLLAQRLQDLEILFVGKSSVLMQFIERRRADPRFRMAASAEMAVREARGEFLAFVHGSTALDHRLLSRSVAALERRPRTGWVRSAYGIPTTEGIDVYRSSADTAAIDGRWGAGLPVFGLTRRRDLMKSVRAGAGVTEAWEWVTSGLEEVSHGTPLVLLPATTPAQPRPERLELPRSLRSMVVSDLRSGGRQAATAPLRALRAKVTGGSYQTTPVHPHQALPVPFDGRARVRYVGWTGRDNLGDEAMLQAVKVLFDWGDISTTGNPGDLLMLGGGTLINRGYLRRVRPHDSPRVERVTFGTGVAHPEFWGEPEEDPKEWIAFLESCLYVGVRGPRSADLLDEWGLKRDLEVVGDPALSLLPKDGTERVEGRVVVCPAWSRGLLWGDSDESVFDAFSDLIRHLRNEGHEVWALSAFPGDDRHIIEMMRRADAPDLPYLAAHDDPDAGVGLLASAELVVAERLHGAVLAAAAGTVPVMVEYRPKLRDFAESVGLGELVIKTDALGGGALVELTDSAYRRRSDLAARMSANVNRLRNRQVEAAEEIEKALR